MNFKTRWYIRISGLIIPIWLFIASYKEVKHLPKTLEIVVIFLLIFGFIIIITSDFRILIRQEFLIIKNGLRKRKILYQNIFELDFRQRFWGRHKYYFEIKFITKKNKKKSVFIDPLNFGMDNILRIVDALVHKNNRLSGFKSRFLQ